MKPIYTRTNILTLAALIIIPLILTANNLYAAWSAPTTNPPDGNVPAPLNTGTAHQTKEGILGVGAHVRSNTYCDINGDHCTAAADLGANTRGPAVYSCPTVTGFCNSYCTGQIKLSAATCYYSHGFLCASKTTRTCSRQGYLLKP